MPLYESIFITRQDISTNQVDVIANDFETIIKDNGGDMKKREYWGLRTLSYPIKKNKKGHYVLFNCDAPSDAIKEMERLMRLNEDVIRYLTVKIDEVDDEPSVIMQSRNFKDFDKGPSNSKPKSATA